MKKRVFRILAVTALILTAVLTLSSCGGNKNGAKNVKDANGDWLGFAWTYQKDGKTLTVTGNGAMPAAATSADVGWASVRAGVEKVVINGSVTTVGDYAFYGMSALKYISIPEGVTSVGRCAFSFCSALEDITIPQSTVSVGNSAFEACSSLKSITLPENVNAVGERAFAYCRSLKDISVKGEVKSFENWTFKDCTALEVVAAQNGDIAVSDSAFEGAKIGKNNISDVSKTVSVTVKYVDGDGNTLAPSLTEIKSYGQNYNYNAMAIDGYTMPEESNFNGTVTGESSDVEHTFVYRKAEATEATEAPAATEASEKSKKESSPVGTIVALSIFGVVIVGICVGAALLIRSDKKKKKSGNTVRKNAGGAKSDQKNSGGKNGKNGKK